jgi:uncharacterized protein (TIGR04255 family)
MVRTSPPPFLERSIQALQQSLATKYPELRKSKIQTLALLPNASATEVSAWELIDEAQVTGVVVREDMWAFHATAYSNFDNFLQHLEKALQAYETVLDKGRPICHQVGLRYIDIIVPENGRDPNDYVVSGIHGVEMPFSNGRETSVTVMQFPRDNGAMTFRYTRQFVEGGSVPFPGDLVQQSLKFGSVHQRAMKHKGQIGVLDFDRFIIQRMTFDAKTIVDYFRILHDDHSEAFKAVMSAHAREYWNNPQSEMAT